MKLVDKQIDIGDLKKMSSKMFGGLVKAVVDIKKKVLVVNGEMHADEEKYLLDKGSRQDDLWGINLYPDADDNNFIEFDSVINLRPRMKNFSRGVDNPKIREKIIRIVKKLVKK